MTATTDLSGLLRAAVQNPDCDATRLVLADEFQTCGDEERAELIRVQCELARELADIAPHHHKSLDMILDPDIRDQQLWKHRVWLMQDRESHLLRAENLTRWRTPACSACQGGKPECERPLRSGVNMETIVGVPKGTIVAKCGKCAGCGLGECPTCRGQGSQHPLAERYKGHNVDGTEGGWLRTATLVRGLWRVEVPFAEMGGPSEVDCPDCDGTGWEDGHPLGSECRGRCRGAGTILGPWQFRPDWLAWAVACVREGVTFRVSGREPVGPLVWQGKQVWSWDRRDELRRGEDLPPLVFEALQSGDTCARYLNGKPATLVYYTAADAHADLDRALLRLVCRAAWPEVTEETT